MLINKDYSTAGQSVFLAGIPAVIKGYGTYRYMEDVPADIEVIKKLKEYFKEHPNEKSVSIVDL